MLQIITVARALQLQKPVFYLTCGVDKKRII